MFALLAVLAVVCPRPEDPEVVARTQLERAEALVREKHYDEARALYAKTAKELPDTVAGKECAWRSKPSAYLGWSDLVRNGPSENRVDLVVLGEGYEQDDLDRYDQAAEDLPHYFEFQPVLAEYSLYFNFLRGVLVSKEAGVAGYGRTCDTALGAHLRATDLVDVGVDAMRVREMLERIPGNDGQAIVLVRQGMAMSSAPGVTVLTGTSWLALFHQFGHGFGLLGDEYHQGAYLNAAQCAADHEHGPNVSESAEHDLIPWKHWLDAKHPEVGVHEGAAGRLKGAYRPTSNCAMFSNRWYCPVCREAVLLRIYSFVDPIDACTPRPPPPGIREPLLLAEGKLTFEVRVLQPLTHQLESRWWVLPGEAPPPVREPATQGTPARPADTSAPARAPLAKGERVDRSARGPLAPLADRPQRVITSTEGGVHRFELWKRDLAPGRYRVVCRVRDTTKLRDEKWAWILSDPRGLLESERVWWVEIPPKR